MLVDDAKAWWARADGIRYSGPYESQERAWAAVMGLDGTPVKDALVWYGPSPNKEYKISAPKKRSSLSGLIGKRVRVTRPESVFFNDVMEVTSIEPDGHLVLDRRVLIWPSAVEVLP